MIRSLPDRVRWFGTRYKCPLCHACLRGLKPFGQQFAVLREKQVIGGGRRDNALCPICGSTDRERLLYLYLRHHTPVFRKPLRLLHVAPEPCLSEKLRRHGDIEYVTADIAPGPVMARLDLTRMSFPDNCFDVIICNHVLEHIANDHDAMVELLRVLKTGGWALLQVPVSLTLESTYDDASIVAPHDRETAFGQSDHVRIYARDYLQRLKHAGFAVRTFDWNSDRARFGGRRNRYALIDSELIYLAGNPP